MTGRSDGFVLGVDLGTSHTVAMLRHPDGRTRPLLFDGQPLLPSAVFLDREGRLHVGTDARRLGHAEPARLEPHPKRHIDSGSVLLGETSIAVADLLGALLAAVAREAVATAGFLPPAVLTYPASWGEVRRRVLTDAIGKAGWPPSYRLTPEPVAAARYFADVLRRPVPAGASLAVFDFGGGTLDIAVVRNDGAGPDGRSHFSVTASGGADDLGGLDLDEALVDHLGKQLAGGEPEAWLALTEPKTLAQWRARRQFWDDVRGAKEMLSRTAFAPVAVPGVEHAVQLTRAELEAAIDPLIRRGVSEAADLLAAAGLAPTDLAGLFLVGGSSRVPMVARLLHSGLGVSPTVLEQPEFPVAEGAILTVAAGVPVRYTQGVATAATPTPTPATRTAARPLTDTKAEAVAPLSPAASSSAATPPAASPSAGVPSAVSPSAGAPSAAVPPSAVAPTGAPARTPAPAARTADESTDDRHYGEPVDPWATGEARAMSAGGHALYPGSTPPWLASDMSDQSAAVGPAPTQHGPAPTQHGPAYPISSPPSAATSGAAAPPPHYAPPAGPGPAASKPGRRKRAYLMIGAAALTVVLAAGAAVAWIFWPGYRSLDYHLLSEPTRIEPALPVTSAWSDAEILGNRVYFASSDYDTGAIGVVAVGLGDRKQIWSSREAGQADTWRTMIALPVGAALFGDLNGGKKRLVVLGAGQGRKLWERTLGPDDDVFFTGDSAVIALREEKRLVGLRLSDGRERWSKPDPAATISRQAGVVAVTTPDDIEGPALVNGRPFEPDPTDDPRIVQIGADQSARVINADSGDVLTKRQGVADPDTLMTAHNGRLILVQKGDFPQLVSYQLDNLTEPKVLYTPQAAEAQIKSLVPCGDDRVCFVEQAGYDSKNAEVVSLDVAGGDVAWRYRLGSVDSLVPVGEAVIATTTTPETTLIDATGKAVWKGAGEAARLDGGNLLEFSKTLSRSPDDPTVYGRHLGDEKVPLGALDNVRSDTCSWNTSVLACAAEKDFVLQTFAG